MGLSRAFISQHVFFTSLPVLILCAMSGTSCFIIIHDLQDHSLETIHINQSKAQGGFQINILMAAQSSPSRRPAFFFSLINHFKENNIYGVRFYRNNYNQMTHLTKQQILLLQLKQTIIKLITQLLLAKRVSRFLSVYIKEGMFVKPDWSQKVNIKVIKSTNSMPCESI